VLEQLYEKEQKKSFELLRRDLSRWGNQKMFSLAEKVDGIDFVKNYCCQTYLDQTWIGRTSKCDWAYIKVTDHLTL